MVHHDHHARAPSAVCCAVITVSDTRDEASDVSGRLIQEALQEKGHTVALYRLVPDEPSMIEKAIEEAQAREGLRAVLITGGTGIGPRDQTYEVVSRLLDKCLEGFGELFRMLSFEDIGPSAMLSRAVAGISRGTVIFAMPGSPRAVRLAMERLILPELGHIVGELERAHGPQGDE
jgi:molybdenum cofactor biosynthesis protein B